MSDAKRTLNLFDTIMLVSGSMIGSGVFIVSADMMTALGSPYWVLFCWILSGVITLFAALSYGELAGMMPDAGGQFIYLKRAYGRMTAFVYGWTVFTVIQTGVIAAVAVAFARFAGVLFPFFNENNILFAVGDFKISTTQLLGIGSVLFLTFLNSRGINNGKIIQRVFTSAKIFALFGLILIGFFASGAGHWAENISIPFPSRTSGGGIDFSLLFGAIGVALIGSLFSSDAWNNVTFIAGEIKQPKRNIPLGLMIGVLIVTLLYILANMAYFILLPAAAVQSSNTVGTTALGTVFGDISAYIMAVLIVISTFGCNNGLILSGARLFQSMAHEGLFFKQAAGLNKQGVPAKALWIQSIWASALCLSGSYGALLNYCTFASLVFYMITISALFYFRVKEPNAERPYRAIGYPVLPALYILITLVICVNLLIYKTEHSGLGLLIMLLGIPVFYIFDKQNKHPLLPK